MGLQEDIPYKSVNYTILPMCVPFPHTVRLILLASSSEVQSQLEGKTT